MRDRSIHRLITWLTVASLFISMAAFIAGLGVARPAGAERPPA